MTALVNMEDFYRMLDGINPQILTNYIYMKLKKTLTNVSEIRRNDDD